jgi:anti-sigma factor RsiW
VKARVLPLDSDEHRMTQELLPWFVNRTLAAAEAAPVAAHLAQCARCQADAAALAAVRAVPIDVDAGGSVERGWAALRGRLDAPPTEARPMAAGRPWWKRGLQLALVAQAVVMLILVGALIGTTTRNEPYQALGGAPGAADANALAVFRADATEQQMREALRVAGARIVGGPTISDAYLLRIVDLQPEALARLRAQPGVLRVESLQGEATR